MSEPLAHSGGHLLAAHLQCVAAKAADFSSTFEPATATRHWAYLAGLWHDLGKYRLGESGRKNPEVRGGSGMRGHFSQSTQNKSSLLEIHR